MFTNAASRAASKAIVPLMIGLLFCACAREQTPGPRASTGIITVDYPLPGSVFPPDFTPPTILWHDDDSRARLWRITIRFDDGAAPITAESDGPPPPRGEIDKDALSPTNEIYQPTGYQRTAKSWTPAPELWAKIQKRSRESDAILSIEGVTGGESQAASSRGEVVFRTSKDPIGGTIFYRDVPLMPSEGRDGTIAPLDRNAYALISWRLRDVSLPESKVVFTGMPTCANCHSFSLDGRTLGMDVDGPDGDKGTYAIARIAKTTVIDDEDVITWNSFPDKPKGHKTIGFLSRISPDGSHVLSTVNEALYVNNFTNYKFLQVFYPTRGILAWYSRETGEMKALPGADDPEYVHCSPVWFPSGEEIIFARAKARDPYPEGQPRPTYSGDPNELPMQYDLYRMPFAEGRGGTPVAVKGASDNGMSNTFPKISPDGKWLIFTQCGNGLLIRPDSRLFIVPASGGEPREMNCNTALMNSWHSFSPNSRWLVFSSKVNTPYTQMFLTHLDENGIDTPPILIPNSTAANRAVNIPEFVARDFDTFDVIEIPAVEHRYVYQRGRDLVDEEDYEAAIPLLRKAVELEPDFSRALVSLGYALLETGKNGEAREYLRRAIAINPRSAPATMNLGLTWWNEGNSEKALELLDQAIALEPNFAFPHHNRGVVLATLGRHDEALPSLERAVALKPYETRLRMDLAHLLKVMRRWDSALAVYARGVELNPEDQVCRQGLAITLLETGRAGEAIGHLEACVEASPEDTNLRRALGNAYLRNGQPDQALIQIEFLLERMPRDMGVLMDAAWLMSTLPQESLRNGERAVLLAKRCRKLHGEQPQILDVLAASYAEAGRFPEAVKTQRRALEIQQRGGAAPAPDLRARLRSYEAGRPYRQ